MTDPTRPAVRQLSRYVHAGRVIAVTGAAQGICAAVVERLARAGASVVLADIQFDLIRLQASRLPGPALALAVDVADPSSVEQAKQRIIDRFGQLDGLVHCAGIRPTEGPSHQLTLAQWNQVIQVNLTGTFVVNTVLSQPMVAHGYGRIVNLAAAAGLSGEARAAAYAAAAGGVIAVTKSLAKELATTGVLINCIAPVATDTPMLANSTQPRSDLPAAIPLGRIAHPSELAALAMWLASDECSFSTGAVFDFTGGQGGS